MRGEGDVICEGGVRQRGMFVREREGCVCVRERCVCVCEGERDVCMSESERTVSVRLRKRGECMCV